MLVVFIQGDELYDPVSEEFITFPDVELKLEHSLLAISDWESKWMKPFLGPGDKTDEEIYDYICCMSLEPVSIQTVKRLTRDNVDLITDYINSPRTATTLRRSNNKPSREVITSEIIYYWMVALTIPFECQNWHINRLLMLINVCNEKNDTKTKTKPISNDTLRERRELNAARKKALSTSG